MTSVLTTAIGDEGFRAGLVVTTLGFGLRHGVDWDHIAAISDITNSQDDRKRSMVLATLYAGGHAVVVFLLGVLAIVAGDRLPASVDAAMERVVGVTLVLLGAYVFYALVRQGRDFRFRSRWMLVFSGVAKLRRRFRRTQVVEVVHDHEHGPGHGHGHDQLVGDGDHLADSPEPGAATAVVATRHHHLHRHRAPMPDDPFASYGKRSAWAVGMLHGIGAETATQVLVFLTAAQVGGTLGGVALLGVFVAGLVASNTAIALATTTGLRVADRRFPVYAAVAVVTGAFSLVIGVLFVAGAGGSLPAIFGA